MFESDEDLVNCILLSKDRTAGEILIEKYYKKIYKLIYLKLKDEELAKDLTQETFIAVLKNLKQFDQQKALFKTWVTRIAENKVIDYLRSRQHHENIMTEMLEDYEQEDTRNIENQVINNIMQARFAGILEKYGNDIIQIFSMKINDGYTFDEISDLMGINKATVKNRYYGTIKKLRKEMQNYE